MNPSNFKSNIFLFLLIFLFSFQIIAQINTYYVSPSGNDGNDGSESTPWQTIQGTIDKPIVDNGDIIIVKDGNYNENIVLNKELTIQSENGYENTTIEAAVTDQHVFEITSNYTTINGFTIYGATTYPFSSFYLNTANYCTLSNNRIGYDVDHKSSYGIWLLESDYTQFSDNICNYNSYGGITFENSDNTQILNSNFDYNRYGFSFNKYSPSNYNTFQNCSISYCTNTGVNNSGGSNNNYLNNSIIHNGTDGIAFSYSADNKLRGNTIEFNGQHGVNLKGNGNGADLGSSNVGDKGNNTIRLNGGYDLYNGTTGTINAYYNTWSYNDAAHIDSRIFDDDENASFGEVFFDPFNPGIINTHYVAKTGNDVTGDGSEANPWLTIQGAIDNEDVDNGDIIIVKDGTYNENVVLSKELTIQSATGYLTTSIVAFNTSNHVFTITSDNSTINGFTIYGATTYPYSSFYLNTANYCTLSNNRIGYDVDHKSSYGIWLLESDYTQFSDNICNYNSYGGITFENSDNTQILNSNFDYNRYGFSFNKYKPSHYNTIQNCSASYCTNVGINNNGGSNNTYLDNTISHNGADGIAFSYSADNKLRDNTIEFNGQHGVNLGGSADLGSSDISDKGNNTFRLNGGYDVYNGTTGTINAFYNNWGSNDAIIIDSHIRDNEEDGGEVFFNPWFDGEVILQLELTVLLEGPYNSGEMSTSLLDQSSIPTTQPYNTLPWEYQGTENVDPIPPNIVDWVLVELRTSEAATSMVKQVVGLLDKDGKIVDLDGSSPLKINYYEGDYYIVVYQRNHLPVMTSEAIYLGL